jgi:hypothetical protein
MAHTAVALRPPFGLLFTFVVASLALHNGADWSARLQMLAHVAASLAIAFVAYYGG